MRHFAHNRSPVRRLFSLALTLTLLFPISPPKIFNHEQNQMTLSPPTTAKPGFTQADRLALWSTIFTTADDRRPNIDDEVYQGYDVRGRAMEHKGKHAQLLPEDAFLTAESVSYVYKREFKKATEAGTLDPKRNPEGKPPRILITGDGRTTTPALIAAAAAGAASQGLQVDYDPDGHAPTGATSLYGLLKDYDIVIQITGSHKGPEMNGMKIAVRQQMNGYFDPSKLLSPLYGNREVRPYELKGIVTKVIREKKAEILAKRKPSNKWLINNIHGKNVDYTGSYLEGKEGLPNYGRVVQVYINALKRRFKPLKHKRRIVFDPGNGMGVAGIPVLEGQGNEIVEGLYLEVKGVPDHPADPSKDTSGKDEISKSGCRACIDAVKRWNQEIPEGELPVVGVLTDGDGDRSGLVDEDGIAIRPSIIATLIYRRFILENKEILEQLHEMRDPITLALDVRSSSIMEDITGVIDGEGNVIKRSRYPGVQGKYISAGNPSHKDHVAHEIEKLLKLEREFETDPSIARALGITSTKGRKKFLLQLQELMDSFVSAEASGHYFAGTDETHPEVMLDDGIYYAARVFEILDTWNDFEAKDRSIYAENDPNLKEVYLLKDIFSEKSIPRLPSPDEPRADSYQRLKKRYDFVKDRQDELMAQREGGEVKIRGDIDMLVPMNQIVDGVRVNFTDGSAFLVRTSNTGPKFTFMIEGKTWARVVEILEDALTWLEPIEEADLQQDEDTIERELRLDLDVLRDRLVVAKRKEKGTKATKKEYLARRKELDIAI